MNREETALLLTRPRHASERFAAEVEAELGGFRSVVISPLLDIRPVAASLPEEPNLYAISSESAISMLDGDILGGAFCVGRRAADAAQRAGLEIRGVASDVASLTEMIAEGHVDEEVIHLSGRHQAGDLAKSLVDRGIAARRIVVYDQVEQLLSIKALELLDADAMVIAPIFSPRTAHVFGAQLDLPRAELHVVALSEAVANAWTHVRPASLTVAEHPNSASMLAAISGLI